MARVIVCATVLAACLTLAGCGGSGPGDAAVGFYKAVGAGDVEKAKTFVAPADREGLDGFGLEGLVTTMGEVAKEMGGLKSVTVVNETVTGDTASVKLKLEFGKAGAPKELDSVDANLKKVDGKWYVAP